MWITSSLQATKVPTHIALGNFDGVHLGHQRVMAEVVGVRSSSDLTVQNSAARPVHATVVTFSPHPQAYFSGVSRPLLTPVGEKARQLALLGIEQLVMLPFNQALAALSPEDFVSKILIDALQAQRISVGSDFRFGKDRSGDALKLKAIAAKYNVPVVLVPLREEKGDRISSSRIRKALQTGNLSEASELLGRPYQLAGTVVEGKQIGRTIGFPTANLQVSREKFLPCKGVYSVWVYLAAKKAQVQAIQMPIKGVMNIGNRPTVNGQTLSLEVHLLDWSGDLYGESITIDLGEFIRPEQKFESLEALKTQIVKDCETARQSLGSRPNAVANSVLGVT
ncbi:MAG: bifunctional riboflavin kinase/FAD synthetase [Cyanobacteria bacterium P01_D01_bin.105]